jgi:membrane protein
MRFDLRYLRHWWAVHLRWWRDDARLLMRRTLDEFRDDYCTQLAAGISYYVLFSIFPLTILAVSISGLILTNDSIRDDVVEELFDVLPLSQDEGREDLERAVDSVATGLSAIGLISIFGLLWAASGMMGAVRHALDEAWDLHYRRPFLRAKMIDLLMVTAVGLLVGLSIASTIFLQVARRVSDGVSDFLGPLGAGADVSIEIVAVLVPLTVSFAAFGFIYKVLPSVRTRWREIWPGALLAALLFEVIKNGFAFYLRNFGNYDAVYGSLGAVLAFLFFVYVSSNILLLGAEMASEWPRVMHGHYDKGLARGEGGPSAPRSRRILAGLLGLVRTEEEAPDAVEDRGAGAVRRERRMDEVRRRVESDGTPDDESANIGTPDAEAAKGGGAPAEDSDDESTGPSEPGS